MKIGINSRIYQNANTGIPYYIECLYSKLLKSDRNNQYVFFQTNKRKELGYTKIIKIFSNPFGAFLFDFFLVHILIKKERINIYHSPSYILPLLKKNNVRYVVTVHDLSFLIFPKNQSLLFNLYYKYAVGKSLKNADLIIADSKSTKKDIQKFYRIKKHKIKVIYLGVKDVFFRPSLRKRIIKEKYFFSITTHPKRKNIISILKILAENEKLRKYKYVIAGLIESEQLRELKQVICQLNLEDNVLLYGYAREKDLINLYQNAEFFIYPSFYEGFGLPVVEAMACRCPVITSKTSSLIELIPEKKWLIDPYDIKDISDKINILLNLSKEKKNKLLNKNYKFAKKFSWDKTANEYLKVFNLLR